MPTPAAVSPKPVVKLSSASSTGTPATTPTVIAPDGEGEERVQLGGDDQHDDDGDAEQGGEHEPTVGGDGLDEVGPVGEDGEVGGHCGVSSGVVDVLLDDGVDGLVDVDLEAVLAGPERFERGELRVQQRGGHEVAGTAGLTAGDHVARAAEVDEPHSRRVPPAAGRGRRP